MAYNDFLENFDKISKIGWKEEIGVNRASLNEYDLRARYELTSQMERIKAEIEYDDAGNIYGSIGEDENGTITIGSHMDSVPNGGRFDGMYGIISSLQVLKDLSETTPRKRIMLVDFTNEEGSRWEPDLLGSGLATEVFEKDFVYSRVDNENLRFGDVLKSTKFLGSEENRIKKLKPDCFIELHIEQGPVLEKEGYEIGIPLGIVTDIVELYTFIGESNQAGPTPMNMRKDALLAASIFMSRVNEVANKIAPNIVMTVGEIRNLPNVYSVIPQMVQLKLDIRSPDQKIAHEQADKALEIANEIAVEKGVLLKHERGWTLNTTKFNEDLIGIIEKACKKLDLKYKFIYSWATHDAMYMNRITSTGMIMIPSHNGRSHTKEEYSKDSDLISGLKVLRETVNLLL